MPGLAHCWHPTPFSSGMQTLAAGLNSGHSSFACCHCGITRVRLYRQEYRGIDGHGPYVKSVVNVYYPDVDACHHRPAG